MFSLWLLQHRIAKNAAALERIALAKSRVLSILDRETVAHEKTLEKKIADQGPVGQRVDPHLISLAIDDMIELRRLAKHLHPATTNRPWYANIGTPAERVQERLTELAPLYDSVSNQMSNMIGDALEIATFQALRHARNVSPRYHFDGHWFLDHPKNQHGRFVPRPASKHLGDKTTTKDPDFYQFGHDAGTLCIECKNRREWLYPQKDIIKHHILRCDELDTIPVFVFRRIHYSTITNFFLPAGIIAHESLYQYFPSDQHEIAERAKHRRSLGFTDILASEEPHARTVKFFAQDLPRVVTPMAEKWRRNRAALVDYANDRINLAQLYNAIRSPGGGNWVDRNDDEFDGL